MMINGTSSLFIPKVEDTSSVGRILNDLIYIFFQGKFYTLFSLIFGISFYFFSQKAISSYANLKLIYFRRTISLLLFGIFHIIFLWSGDVLVYYAMYGVILYFGRSLSNKSLIRNSYVFYIIPISFLALTNLFTLLAEFSPEAKAGMEEGFNVIILKSEEIIRSYQDGGFFKVMQARIDEFWLSFSSSIIMYLLSLSMFYLGFFIGRKGYLINLDINKNIFRKTNLIALPIGTIMTAIALISKDHTASELTSSWSSMFLSIGSPFLMISYACMIILAHIKHPNAKIFNCFAAVGKMTLTNYLIQSLIVSFIIYQYGLRYFGKISPAIGICLVLVIYIIQIIFSKIWLSKFKLGPMEWIWRILTYGTYR